jgi:hypothetical protein
LEIQVMGFKNLIDQFDLQNDLGGQSYKIKCSWKKIVKKTVINTFML